MTYFVKQKWTDFQYLYAKSYKTGIPKGLGYVIAAKSISTKVLTQGGEQKWMSASQIFLQIENPWCHFLSTSKLCTALCWSIRQKTEHMLKFEIIV